MHRNEFAKKYFVLILIPVYRRKFSNKSMGIGVPFNFSNVIGEKLSL